MNIRAFFEIEKVKGKSILQKRVLERTAKATKIGYQGNNKRIQRSR